MYVELLWCSGYNIVLGFENGEVEVIFLCAVIYYDNKESSFG
jgi:hypothetical protein